MVGCRAGGRRSEGGLARSSGVVMVLSRAVAGRQRAQQARAAAAQQAGGSGAASASVRTRALCARGVNAERRKGERERVLWSMILTRFKNQNFQLKLEKL